MKRVNDFLVGGLENIIHSEIIKELFIQRIQSRLNRWNDLLLKVCALCVAIHQTSYASLIIIAAR
jgi:hypothetical protein